MTTSMTPSSASGTITFTPVSPADVGMGPQKAGYWVDLYTTNLDETNGLHWIQAMPLGEYEHPLHGKIKVTPERVQRFAANVKAKVRGTDLDIDYDHKERSGEAAGWVKDAEARPDGLWLAVEWTRDAYEKIKNKAYRYFSPEFVDTWTHPKTNQKYDDVLFGGGLTNRPFLKDILPINMSDVILTGGYMLKETAKLLGLPEDADEQTVMSALQAKLSATPEPDPQPDPPQPDPQPEPTPEPSAEQVPVSASELVKLAESNPAVKVLMDRVATLEAATRLSEVTVQLSELTTDKQTVAPAMLDDLRSVLVEAPKPLADKFFAAVKNIVTSGIVQLGESGFTRSTNAEGESATKRFTDEVDKHVKANPDVSYAQAAEIVASDNPLLFTEYRNESFVRESV